MVYSSRFDKAIAFPEGKCEGGCRLHHVCCWVLHSRVGGGWPTHSRGPGCVHVRSGEFFIVSARECLRTRRCFLGNHHFVFCEREEHARFEKETSGQIFLKLNFGTFTRFIIL